MFAFEFAASNAAVRGPLFTVKLSVLPPGNVFTSIGSESETVIGMVLPSTNVAVAPGPVIAVICG